MLNLEEQVDLLSADVEDACCVEDILACEDKMKTLDGENETWLPNKVDDIENKIKDMKLADAAFGDTVAQEHYNTQRMRLDYREGRLLLHSTAHPADGHVSIKVCTARKLLLHSLYMNEVYTSLNIIFFFKS